MIRMKKEIQRLVQSSSNRIFVPIDKIPKHIQDAFIAIEDLNVFGLTME